MVKGLLGVLEVFFPLWCLWSFPLLVISSGVWNLVQRIIFLSFIENCENHRTKNDMFDEEKRNYLQGVQRILW